MPAAGWWGGLTETWGVLGRLGWGVLDPSRALLFLQPPLWPTGPFPAPAVQRACLRHRTVSSEASGPNGIAFSEVFLKRWLAWDGGCVFVLFACSIQKAAFVLVTSQLSPWLS